MCYKQHGVENIPVKADGTYKRDRRGFGVSIAIIGRGGWILLKKIKPENVPPDMRLLHPLLSDRKGRQSAVLCRFVFLKRGTLTDMQRQTQGDPEGHWKTRKIKDDELAMAQRPKEVFSFLFKIYLLQGVCSLALYCRFHFTEDQVGAVSGCRKNSVSWLGRPSF